MAPSCRFVPLGPSGLITKARAPGREVFSGRATAIAVHPLDTKIIYLGTAGGGVWKTSDAGGHWRPLTDRQWTLSIGALAIDPANPDRVYAGTGEANISVRSFASEGLLISDDAGAAWRRMILSEDVTTISKIVVSSSGDRVFIGTDEGLFLLRPQAPPASQLQVVDQDPVSDLVFDEAGDRLFIAKRKQGLGLLAGAGPVVQLGRSGDPATMLPDLVALAGKTNDFRLGLAWIPSDPNTLFVVVGNDLAFLAPNQSFLLGVFRSNDGGSTWTAVAGPLKAGAPATGIFAEGQAAYNLLFARDPQAPSNLFLGLKSLFRSTSLGADWSENAATPATPLHGDGDEGEQLHLDQHAIAFAATGEIWVGNDGGIWRSQTRGETWNHRNRGLGTMQFYNGAADPDLPGFVMGGTQDNGFQQFEGHPIWQVAGDNDVGMVALDTKNQRLWMATNAGAIMFKGTRQGPWREVPFPKEKKTGLFLAPFAVAPSDPAVVYTGSQGALFKVDADASTWLVVPEYDNPSNAAVSALAVAAGNPRLVYVADTAPTVTRVELGSPAVDLKFPDDPSPRPGRFISDLAVSPRDDNRLYVVIGEVGGGTRPARQRLLRCDAGAMAWEDLTSKLPSFGMGTETRSPFGNPVHAVLVDPDPSVTDPTQEHVYIGCDWGVYRSNDGGDTWQLIDHGLPLTPVYDLTFQPSTRRLLAFTHGRGVWMRAADVEPCVVPPPAREVDLYLRDQRYDIGLGPTPADLTDPLRYTAPPEPPGNAGADGKRRAAPPPRTPLVLHSTDGVDLKIDRPSVASEVEIGDEEATFQDPASTVNYAPDGPLDAIGFEALKHRPPNPNAPARVYLQVHNRGPDEAIDVAVRVYWGAQAADGGYPDLPADFWSRYPDGDPAPDSPWQPIGPKSTVASVQPAQPEIVLWTWKIPAQLPAKIGLLAIVTSSDDPVSEGQAPEAMERRLDPLVRNNKRVLLKTTDTLPAAHSWGWLKWVGLAVGVGAGAVLLYEELK